MSSIQARFIRAALVCASGLCVFAPASVVQAQEAAAKESTDQLETVVVTGSRIQRRDYEANSPILTVDDSLLKNSSTAAIETDLAKLPQFHPVQTPAQGGDIQPTATNTPGAATISLRGLGTNRSLILLDGRRATPGNASQVVDINTIPSSAIERIETITGGASATYGADAVGGVVNFIMRKNFQGLQVDAQTAQSSRGDAQEYQIGGILGANLNDDKGNVSIAFSTNHRQAAKHIDRPWFADMDRNPTMRGNDWEFFPDFSGYDPNFPNFPTQGAMDAIFGAGAVAAPSRIYFNEDGTAFTGFFQSPNGGASHFNGDLTGTKWKQLTTGELSQSFQGALAVLPLQRDNLFARGNYEINDSIGFFFQGMFSKVETRTVQQPSPSVNGWAAGFIPVDGRAIPADLASILASRPDPTGPWRLTYYLNYANRESRVDVMTYNMQAGLQGKIPGTDWTWELYGSKGESETTSLLTGVASLERFRAVIQSPNWGAGFDSKAAGYSNPAFGGFGASTATCTSGFDPFNKSAPISKDCIEAISADLKTRASLQQDIWEANAQGKVVDMPAGELRAAVGATYRQTRYEFLNDTLTTQGRSFLDQSIGIYPSGNSAGNITAKEFYGELLVPLLKDLPLVQKLELELGARSSHYDTTGNSTTYKALANWQPVGWLRVRGGFNRAERSPNIAELYLAPQQTFVFNASGDLCTLTNPSKFSANPSSNAGGAAGAQAAHDLCVALMEKSKAGTAANFYADPAFYNNGGPSFAFPTLQGNPTVTPEKANTWTLGAVFDSPFESEMARQLRLSIDYYSIKVDDAIGPQSVDVAQRQCFDPAFNPGLSINSPYCAGINRVAGDGALGNIITTYYNNGRFQTTGIDTQIDWAFNLGPGRFSLNSVFTYLLSLKSAELLVDPLVDYAGSLGPTQNGLNPGSFKWKMFNTFGYGIAKWNASLQWQHLPSADSAARPTNPNTTNTGVSSYDTFNLSGSFAIMKDAVLRFGVDNLFDKAPPITEVNTQPFPGTVAGGAFNDVLYDVNGRRFYLGATVKL